MKCPLGYDTLDEACAAAPCMECMRRLGEDIVRDMQGLHEVNAEPIRNIVQTAEQNIAHCYLNDAQRKKFLEWVPPSQWTLKAILETLAEQKIRYETTMRHPTGNGRHQL